MLGCRMPASRHERTTKPDLAEPESQEQPVVPTDRPTALPAFDPSEFARASESKLFAAASSEDRHPIDEAFSRIGTMSSVPWLMVPISEVRTLPLDPRSAFILSLVDGISTVEMIVDMSSIPRDDGLRVLIELVALGAVELH